MTLPKPVVKFHRWLSLSLLAFWMVQALTGVLIVFHWEMDDALVPGGPVAVDLPAIERRIAELAPEGSGASVGSVWESGGVAGRFDLYLDRPDRSSVVLVDGQGKVLRERADGEMVAQGGWVDTLVVLHHNLLAGDVGSWIVGISGVVLLTNLILGLALGWPQRGQWRAVLLPRRGLSGTASTYAWHRAVGLWAAIPALLTVGAGVLMVFSGGVETIVEPPAVEAPVVADMSEHDVGFARAVASAHQAFPGARLSGVSLPSEEDAFYRVRLLQPDESRRVYGTTTVYVRAENGRIAASYDALADGPARSFVDGLFPFHTGEMGGLAGRLAVMGIGLWLLTMLALGFTLWCRRTRR